MRWQHPLDSGLIINLFRDLEVVQELLVFCLLGIFGCRKGQRHHSKGVGTHFFPWVSRQQHRNCECVSHVSVLHCFDPTKWAPAVHNSNRQKEKMNLMYVTCASSIFKILEYLSCASFDSGSEYTVDIISTALQSVVL